MWNGCNECDEYWEMKSYLAIEGSFESVARSCGAGCPGVWLSVHVQRIQWTDFDENCVYCHGLDGYAWQWFCEPTGVFTLDTSTRSQSTKILGGLWFPYKMLLIIIKSHSPLCFPTIFPVSTSIKFPGFGSMYWNLKGSNSINNDYADSDGF